MRKSGAGLLVVVLLVCWSYGDIPFPFGAGYNVQNIKQADAAVGDVNLGRWTGGVQSQGNLPESWTAPNGLFPTETRNDNSTYSFSSSDSTLTLPSTIEADGYLMIGRYEYADTSNGRFNPQCKIVQDSGSGNFVGPPAGGFNRRDQENISYVSCFAFVDNPSSSATFQFQWRAGIRDGTGGTQTSSFDVIPLYYAEHGMYTSTGIELYGNITPSQVRSWSVVSESDTNAIEHSSNVFTVKNDNKRYLVLSGQFFEDLAVNDRTQRWFGYDYDGSQDNAAKAYAYYRNDGTDESGNHVFDLIETSTSNRTIEVTAYRGDGTNNNEGGAEDAGNTPTAVDQALVILELNDGAEVWRSHSNSSQDLDTGGIVDIDIAPSATVDFNDSDSFTRSSDSAVNAEQAMDALVGANISAANRDITQTDGQARLQTKAAITVNSSEDTYVTHGNYQRGDQAGTGTFGHSQNPIGFVALSQNDDIGVSSEQTGDSSGDVTAQSGWSGFWALNLNTLNETESSNSLPTASGVSIDSDASSVTLTENTTADVVCEGTVTDTDGYTDIAAVGAFFYKTTTGTSTADDANNKYSLYGDSECVPSSGAGNSEDYTCTFSVEYYADPTDAGSPDSATDWTCEMWPEDAVASGTPATDTIEMASLTALDVSGSIDYGSLNPNTDTGGTNQSVTVTNTGNRDMDPQVSGTTMTKDSDTIAVESQEYASTTFTYGDGTDLTGSGVSVDMDLPQRTDGVVSAPLYWGLGIPDGTPAGAYSGTNTFSASAGI